MILAKLGPHVNEIIYDSCCEKFSEHLMVTFSYNQTKRFNMATNAILYCGLPHIVTKA